MRGTEGEHQGVTKATWLGHTLFLVEMPFVSSLGSGAKVLFDLYSAMVAHLPSFSDVPEANAVVIPVSSLLFDSGVANVAASIIIMTSTHCPF